jgi:hypothetical protein
MNSAAAKAVSIICTLFAAVIVFNLIENSYSPALQKCINDDYDSHNTDYFKNRGPIITHFISIQTLCSMRLVDRHSGFFAAIVSALLALITWRQASIAREQSNTSRAQLRAYVMVDKATTIGFGPNPRAQVFFKNYGQTPAYDLVIWTSVEVAVNDLKRRPSAPPSGPAASGSLGPGGFVHTFDPPDRVILPNEVEAVRDGRASFYVYGQASYKDVFGNNHATDFCFVYGGEEGLHPEGLMAQYKTWNKTT